MDKTDQVENKLVIVKRREYGTPVDSVDIIQPIVHSQRCFVSKPSSSKCELLTRKSETREPVGKKKSNRRRKRTKTVKQKDDETKPNTNSDVLDVLSQNLKNMLIPKKIIFNNQAALKSDPQVHILENFASCNKSKLDIDHKIMKITKKSKLKVHDRNNGEKTSKVKKRIDTANKNSKRGSKSKNKVGRAKKHNNWNEDEEISFTDYISLEQVELGLTTGTLTKGYIRINPKDYKTAYIANPNKCENDIMVEGVLDRNRALEGDLVVVQLKGETEWRSPQHKTASVVYILQQVHPHTAIGCLRLAPDKNKQYAMFHPRDSRIPRLKISFIDWPLLFYDNADKYENTLFLARIQEWNKVKYGMGTLLENIGMSGEVKVETLAILKENCVDVTPYGEEVSGYLRDAVGKGVVSSEELAVRLDLRQECVFTIDPLTARDLDDAVSYKQLDSGEVEVGVHIADVSHYLTEGTVLDQLVGERATSTYMVQSVYHMLPQELCELCSLVPGEDKLAFSVMWRLSEAGDVLSYSFHRSIVRSCAQLAYEHAQSLIDVQPVELPQISNGYKTSDVERAVRQLHELTARMRRDRFSSGALRIDQPKMCFQIDPATYLPIAYAVHETGPSHQLIEELMLLANMTVAGQLRKHYPRSAFLRAHPPPQDTQMNRLQALLEKVGVLLDVSSAGALQRSLWAYAGDDEVSRARMLVLCYLGAKTMTRAHYLCAGATFLDDNESEYHHYALNVPLYTHFTSPIRRYADVMVHRQLAGALGVTAPPSYPIEVIADVAANCNKQKYNAKRAGEQSLELYYVLYVERCGSLIEKAVVCEVRESSFDVIVLNSGVVCRVFLNTLPKNVKYQILDEDGKEANKGVNDKRELSSEKKIKTLTISWGEKQDQAERQIISIFILVSVRLSKHEKKLKLQAELLKPS